MTEKLADLWGYCVRQTQRDPMERIKSPDPYWDRLGEREQKICLAMITALAVMEWSMVLLGMWIVWRALRWSMGL